MPFFNENVKEYMNRNNWPIFKQTVEELEVSLGAPIRVLDLDNAGRDRGTHATWRGGSRTLTHYIEGTTEADFHAKGVTIFLRAFNNNADDRVAAGIPADAHWQNVTFNIADLVTEGAGRYENGALPTAADAEYYGLNPEQVEPMDCVPIINHGVLIGDIWDDGRCIFISSALWTAMQYGTVDWQKVLVEPLAEATDPELLERARAAAREQARLAFATMLEDRGDAAIIESREKSIVFAIEVGELEEKLVNAKGNRESYARQLTFLLDQGPELNETLIEKEWKGITDNVNVERFTAGKSTIDNRFGGTRENHWLKVYTKDLFITNPENHREMALGRFEVLMNFGSNSLKIKNLTMPQHGGTGFDANRAQVGVGQWDHPHVLNGKLCQAEYATAITTLLRDRKLAAMTGMLFSILGTITLDDNWGRNNVRLWEQADAALRSAKGWPEWTADETEHPMRAALAEEA